MSVACAGGVLAVLLGLSMPERAEAGPEQDHVGIFINDIQKVDLASESFTIDFWLWHRWTDPARNPAATMEFMNAFESWDGKATPAFDTPQELSDGSWFMSTRYEGHFSTALPLTAYPFDSQELQIVFEDTAAGTGDLIYLADDPAVTVNPDLQLSDYDLGTPRLTVGAKTYPTNFGDTDLEQLEAYSRAVLHIPLVRPNAMFGFKVIFPILIVTACAALAFWIHPEHSEARVGLVVTALLTLVALQLTSNAALPELNYMIMLDALFFLGYLYVLSSLAQVVRSHWVMRGGDERVAIRQDRQMFAGLTLAFALGFALVLWGGVFS